MSAKHVIFWDFDGTLTSRTGRWSGWAGALLRVVDEHPGAPRVSRGLLDHLCDEGFPWDTPQTPHPELNDAAAWWARAERNFVRIYRAAGLRADLAELLAARVRGALLSSGGWTVFDDVHPALTLLAERGWRQIVISNSFPELPQIVASLGLAPLFDDVFSSAGLGFEKPHPGIYQAAIERAGKPDRIWMVGNDYERDVLAAEHAGIPAILVRERDERASRCFGDLLSAAAFIDKESGSAGQVSMSTGT